MIAHPLVRPTDMFHAFHNAWTLARYLCVKRPLLRAFALPINSHFDLCVLQITLWAYAYRRRLEHHRSVVNELSTVASQQSIGESNPNPPERITHQRYSILIDFRAFEPLLTVRDCNEVSRFLQSGGAKRLVTRSKFRISDFSLIFLLERLSVLFLGEIRGIA